MGYVEGQLETAALGSESGDKMKKGYRHLFEGQVKMGLWCLILRQWDALNTFVVKDGAGEHEGNYSNDFYKTSY